MQMCKCKKKKLLYSDYLKVEVQSGKLIFSQLLDTTFPIIALFIS